MKYRIRIIITLFSSIILAGCQGPYVVIEWTSTIDCLSTESFNAVTSLIKLNHEEIQNVSYAGEWLQGKYYDITYRSNIGTVYCDNSKQVESISFSNINVYQKGLISLDVNDYLFDTTKLDKLYSNAIQRVKSELNFPEEAVFRSQSFEYGRWRDFYGVSGVVESRNDLGIKAELKFSLIYDVSDGNKLVHFMLNEENIFGAKPDLDPQR